MKISLAILGIGMVTLLTYAHLRKFRMSDREAQVEMGNETTSIHVDYHSSGNRKVRNILAKKGNDKLLLLLHGSPSSSSQWIPMVNDSTLSSKMDFLLVDRPGYGYSSFGDPLLSVKKVAEIMNEIVEKYRDAYSEVFVLGTSYGGTVASRLMMDYPGLFDAGILISSSMAPGKEKTYSISHFMDKVPWLFPDFLMVANNEKLDHHNQLAEMAPLWEKIADPILFIHSTTDDLVYPENVNFVLERLNPNLPVKTIWVPNADHGLFWAERELFFEKVKDFVDGKILLKNPPVE